LAPAYPPACQIATVYPNGCFRLHKELYFLSTSLTRFQVGIEPIDALHLRAWFGYDQT
jgi:hypothetical protein